MLSAAKSNENSSLNCNGLPLCLKEPKIMGVLNLTPDSFYKVSRVSNNNELLDKISIPSLTILDTLSNNSLLLDTLLTL